MSDTTTSPLRAAREKRGLSRETVARHLQPPIVSKTLERWEAAGRAPEWRLEQLAALYKRPVSQLRNGRGR